jgi:hypothetical protein
MNQEVAVAYFELQLYKEEGKLRRTNKMCVCLSCVLKHLLESV